MMRTSVDNQTKMENYCIPWAVIRSTGNFVGAAPQAIQSFKNNV
ncbi:hypothetical protein [Chryseobacterium piperi]|nr:hypothetical protein [Chryseobacterium piperi]